MKKPKALAKLKRSSNPEPPKEGVSSVTNNSVSHHRDEILQRAQKFKYPFHRSKHRIAIISIGVVVAAVVLLGSFMVLRLYKWQNTTDFTRRVTSILPFPVANVNGERTSYESYLFELNSSIHWQEKYGTTDLKSPDGQRQIEYLKRSALDKAMTNTVAGTLADKNNISVSNEEIDAVVGRIKAGGGNLDQILSEQYNFTESELRRSIKNSILQRKVAHELDKDAPKRAEAILAQITGGLAFSEAAKNSSEDLETKQLAGDIGVVEKGRANLPDEVTEAIFKLQPNQVSGVISTSGDYFIAKVTEKVDENRVRVSLIRIKVKDMSQYLQEYRDQGKVKEYIKLEAVQPIE